MTKDLQNKFYNLEKTIIVFFDFECPYSFILNEWICEMGLEQKVSWIPVLNRRYYPRKYNFKKLDSYDVFIKPPCKQMDSGILATTLEWIREHEAHKFHEARKRMFRAIWQRDLSLSTFEEIQLLLNDLCKIDRAGLENYSSIVHQNKLICVNKIHQRSTPTIVKMDSWDLVEIKAKNDLRNLFSNNENLFHIGEVDQLLDSCYFVQKIVDTIADSFFILKDNFEIQYCNKAACDHLDKKLVDLKGESYNHIFNKINYLELGSLKKDRKVTFEIKEQDKYWDVSCIKMLEDDEYTYLISMKDVSEKYEENSRTIQTSKLSLVGEMASGIAHEINNPLSIIDGHASILQRRLSKLPDPDPKVVQSLNLIRTTVQRITKIIRGLLLFSRDASLLEYEKTLFSKIWEDSILLCTRKIANQNIRLEALISDDCEIECLEIQISQVLLNIINNAYDFLSKSNYEGDAWINVQSFQEADEYVIEISNAGEKIDQVTIEKIFNPFFTTKAPGEGTGLGLSISKGIIENHGGSLQILAKREHTTFQIRLPIKQPTSTKVTLVS